MIRKKIAVIGLGNFGRVLVERLFLEGHEVLAIDHDPEIIDEIKDVTTAAVILDATDENAMRSQGLEEMDVVVISVAESFETLVIASDILKKIHVKEIHARYKSPLQKRILKMIGVDQVFNPEEKAATNMAESLRHQGILSNLLLSEEYRIAEVKIPDVFVGSSIESANLREEYNLNIITIKRKIRNPDRRRNVDEEEEQILGTPVSQDKLKTNDVLMVFGRQADINRFLDN